MMGADMCEVYKTSSKETITGSTESSLCSKTFGSGRKMSQVHLRSKQPEEWHEPLPAVTEERLRNFESKKGGRIINRGDSLRKRRMNHSSLKERSSDASGGDGSILQRSVTLPEVSDPLREVSTETRRVLLLGTSGVGKTALCRQFQTSEYTSDHEHEEPDSSRWKISVRLDGAETELLVGKQTVSSAETLDEGAIRAHDALLVVYSVVDPPSFCAARGLCHLISSMAVRRPVILVASKCDLVRLRKVTAKEGRSLAVEFGFKYVETSTVISSNIDQLLAGIVAQVRFYSQVDDAPTPEHASHIFQEKRRSRRIQSRTLPSLTVKEILQRMVGQKEPRPCDNLLVM